MINVYFLLHCMFDSWILVYISCYFLQKNSNCCIFIFHCKFGLIFFSLVDDDEVLVVICFLTFVELLKMFFKQNL